MHPTHALLERAGDVVLLEGEVTLPLLVPVETGKVAHGVVALVGPSRAPRGVRLSFSKPRTPHAALSVGIINNAKVVHPRHDTGRI